MDASRFDGWTRAIGTRSGRRTLLQGIAGSTVAFGAIGLIAERTEAKKDDKKKDDKKKKKCDKKTKQKCKERGRLCDGGKCICDRCKGCLETCGGVDCATFPRFEGGFACIDSVFGDCGECTSTSDCDTKYPEDAGNLACLTYFGPICATVQCTPTEGRCALKCGAV
jgi:hypothetical protein